jgi:hypothetical protein
MAVTAAEAKALGFNSDQAKLINRVDGQYVFDKSLAPDREGFQSVGIAKPGEVQMTPYYGDVTGAYRLTQEQYAKAGSTGGVMNTANLAKFMQENEIAALVKSGMSQEEATQQVAANYGKYGLKGAGMSVGAGGGSKSVTSSGDVITTGGYNQQGTPVAGGQYDVNGNYVGINLTAGTSSTPTGTLAVDTFKATLGILIGKEEMTKPWVTQLYKSTSKFYKSGSTVDESFNLAIQDVQDNPDMSEFTKRFKGIYDLTDKRRKGEPVYVPTVAEYFATEKTMADTLKSSNLGELANEDFLGGIIGKAVSVTEFAGRIQNVFDKIDYAPAAIKKTIQDVMPYVDRSSLAKAILTGEQGAKELQTKVAGIEVLAAARQQGLNATTLQSATDLANQGYGYQQALSGYQEVASIIPTAQKLTAIEGGQAYTQQQAENVVFGKSAAEQLALSQLSSREQARYKGSAGNIGSKSLASSNRAY